MEYPFYLLFKCTILFTPFNISNVTFFFQKQIIELTKEIDFAIENYQQKLSRNQKEKENILKNKLDSKGKNKID